MTEATSYPVFALENDLGTIEKIYSLDELLDLSTLTSQTTITGFGTPRVDRSILSCTMIRRVIGSVRMWTLLERRMGCLRCLPGQRGTVLMLTDPDHGLWTTSTLLL